MTNADLVYDGRARKRPPGASELVQRIYTLLTERPEGMTRDELHAELREGWLDTDAYRAYEHNLIRDRKSVDQRRSGPPISYGSDKFKARAQRWWIYRKLTDMESCGTARRVQGTKLWQAGRPPHVHTFTSQTKGTFVPLDVEAKRKREHAATQDNIRREELKADLLAYLADKRVKGRARELAQRSYNYMSGR